MDFPVPDVATLHSHFPTLFSGERRVYDSFIRDPMISARLGLGTVVRAVGIRIGFRTPTHEGLILTQCFPHHRISRISVVRLEVFLLLTSTATTLVRGEYRITVFYRQVTDDEYSVLEYQSREDADRAVKQLDGKDLRGQTVRVAADNEVRPPPMPFTPFLTLLSSVALTTIVGMNDVMTVTVITVTDIARSALPTAVNARAPRHPVVTLTTADRGLPLPAGNTRTAGRPATTEGMIVVPQNPILVRLVTTAVGTTGSGMKRMTDMKTVLPGTLTATRATGKTRERVT